MKTNYIIFDLEWNNTYNYKLNKGMNEIVEIGAIKLNENLEIKDTFKQLIKPTVSKKLDSRFKRLTHITMEEIKASGTDFNTAFSDFSRWCGNEDNVFLSWSNSDLYTLIDNFKRFKNTYNLDFMHKYVDAQSYCMSQIQSTGNNQISLSNFAELLGIVVDENNLHRALDDCYITLSCLRKIFDKTKIKGFIQECDNSYFERLVFKSFYITCANYEHFHLYELELHCPNCNGILKPLHSYEIENKAFKTATKCTSCSNKYWTFIRAKRTYDDIVVAKRFVQINKKRAKSIN